MTQIEFVTELEQALHGNVEERIIQENVRYYNDYISEQRAAGKSEEEIFASLGSPRLIAKTIIDTSGEASTQGNSRAGSYNYSTGSDDSSTGGDGWSFSWMKETASKNWVTKTIAILAIGILQLCREALVTNKMANFAARTWAYGILLFSGSLYALALGAGKFLVWVTPIGGTLFLIGWLCLAYGGFKSK